jgi:hypothetical protein
MGGALKLLFVYRRTLKALVAKTPRGPLRVLGPRIPESRARQCNVGSRCYGRGQTVSPSRTMEMPDT